MPKTHKVYMLDEYCSTLDKQTLNIGLASEYTGEWLSEIKIVWRESQGRFYPKTEFFPEGIPLLGILAEFFADFEKQCQNTPDISPIQVVKLLGKYGFVNNQTFLAA